MRYNFKIIVDNDDEYQINNEKEMMEFLLDVTPSTYMEQVLKIIKTGLNTEIENYMWVDRFFTNNTSYEGFDSSDQYFQINVKFIFNDDLKINKNNLVF